MSRMKSFGKGRSVHFCSCSGFATQTANPHLNQSKNVVLMRKLGRRNLHRGAFPAKGESRMLRSKADPCKVFEWLLHIFQKKKKDILPCSEPSRKVIKRCSSELSVFSEEFAPMVSGLRVTSCIFTMFFSGVVAGGCALSSVTQQTALEFSSRVMRRQALENNQLDGR